MKSTLRFYGRVFRDAVQSSLRAVAQHILIDALVAVVATLVLSQLVLRVPQIKSVVGGQSVADAWAIVIGFSGAIIILGVLLLLWNVVLAPVRIISRLDRKLEEALARARRLEADLIPNIKVSPSTGLQKYGVGKHLMWAELEVQNTHPIKPLNNAQVRVIDCQNIQPDQDRGGEYHNLGHLLTDWHPIVLRWAQSDETSADIPGGVSRTALVAYSDDSNGPSGAVFSDADDTRLNLESKIRIEVSSLDSAPWCGDFFIQCHPNYLNGPRARFEFALWEDWVAGKTVHTTGPYHPDHV